MAVIIYIAMQGLGKLDSSSPGRRQVIPEGLWIVNTVPAFNGSTQGTERQQIIQ